MISMGRIITIKEALKNINEQARKMKEKEEAFFNKELDELEEDIQNDERDNIKKNKRN